MINTNLNFVIADFSQLRFFNENILPISTAIWSPKYFVNKTNKGKPFKYTYKDGRQVVYGICSRKLSPYDIDNYDCIDCNIRDGMANKNVADCNFIKAYRKHIYSLDFDELANSLIKIANQINGIQTIALMVYEKADNPCSERHVLKSWFNENGINMTDFNPGG